MDDLTSSTGADPLGRAGTVLSVPMTLGFGESVDPVEVRATMGFVRGEQPHCCESGRNGQLTVDQVAGATGGRVLRASENLSRSYPSWSACIEAEDWTAYIMATRGPAVGVRCFAATPELARKGCEVIMGMVEPAQDDSDDGEVPISFHYLGERGVNTERRNIDAPEWPEIERNYPEVARGRLGELVRMDEGPALGRLVLLHGPPGTGKTTAIRSLARNWRTWCDTSYVMDPEVLFSSSSYLHQLVLEDDSDGWAEPDEGDGTGDGPGRRWRLLVIEDADEIIGADARNRAGQALSRLLNLTDGLLGQGLRTLVLITTNEPMSSLHPALTRPGRCLAEIEIPAFDATGARQWLGTDAAKGQGATLAELFALRDGTSSRPDTPRSASGMYL